MNEPVIEQNLALSSFQDIFSEVVIKPDSGSDFEIRRKALLDSVDTDHRFSYEKRIAVYRNNVHHSLIQALADTFPVVKQLVGEDFFSLMAKEYLHRSPPNSAVLMEFGEGLSEFIGSFEPAQSLGYLSDVANLEYLWQTAYHAEDAQSVGAGFFASIPAESLYEQSLVCHPSLKLLSSEYAVGSIWQQHQQPRQETGKDQPEIIDDSAGQLNIDQPEWLVIVRPEYDVQICFVDEPSYRFVQGLQKQDSLGSVIAGLSEGFPQWDIGQTLAFAIQNGFFVGA